MSLFNFKIFYRKGLDNTKIDALSQRADYALGKLEALYSILQKQADGSITYNYIMIIATFQISDNDQERKIKQSYVKDRLI